jgi:hypothetical protein
VKEVGAEYFDYCDECGEVTDAGKMYEVTYGEVFTIKFCYKCAKKLLHDLYRELQS